MIKLINTVKPQLSIACCLTENSYSIAARDNKNNLLFNHKQVFNDYNIKQMAASFAEVVEKWGLTAYSCKLILLPQQYQITLMDALDVPEAEMAQALRWSLKGFSDYDLSDVVIDAFLIPTTTEDEPKKAFVAITPLSLLNKKRDFCQAAYLDVTEVSISEMTLKALLKCMQTSSESVIESKDNPVIIMDRYNSTKTLNIIYQDQIYLIRELRKHESNANTSDINNIPDEITRSVEYCVNTLNLPEPKQLFFTPSYHKSINDYQPIATNLNLTSTLIDLNNIIKIDKPLSLESQQEEFYSIAGTLL